MDQAARLFSYLVAFVLPGLVGVYALSFRNPLIADWLGVAATQDATVGGFLFAAAAALGVGIFLSGLRWLAIDWIFGPAPSVNAKQRRDPHFEQVYQDVRINHYVFYQFYANTLCALVLLWGLWVTLPGRSGGDALWSGIVVAAVGVVLFLSARDALLKNDRKIRGLGEVAAAEAPAAAGAVPGAGAGRTVSP